MWGLTAEDVALGWQRPHRVEGDAAYVMQRRRSHVGRGDAGLGQALLQLVVVVAVFAVPRLGLAAVPQGEANRSAAAVALEVLPVLIEGEVGKGVLGTGNSVVDVGGGLVATEGPTLRLLAYRLSP